MTGRCLASLPDTQTAWVESRVRGHCRSGPKTDVLMCVLADTDLLSPPP